MNCRVKLRCSTFGLKRLLDKVASALVWIALLALGTSVVAYAKAWPPGTFEDETGDYTRELLTAAFSCGFVTAILGLHILVTAISALGRLRQVRPPVAGSKEFPRD